jgi:hypothetical protein
MDGQALTPTGPGCALVVNATGASELDFVPVPSLPPPPFFKPGPNPQLDPSLPLEVSGSCGGRPDARLVVANTSDMARIAGTSAGAAGVTFPTMEEQFRASSPLDPSGNGLIDPGEPVLLQSLATGQYCKLAALPSNATLIGLRCNQADTSTASVLRYDGNGLQVGISTAQEDLYQCWSCSNCFRCCRQAMHLAFRLT